VALHAARPSTDTEPVQIGTKRRRSSTDPDDEEEQDERTYGTLKRNKGLGTVSPDGEQQAEFFQREESPKAIVPPEKETSEVKEVTQGVEDVDLEEHESPRTDQPQPEKTEEPVDEQIKDIDNSQIQAEEDKSLAAALETPLPADQPSSPTAENADTGATASELEVEAANPTPAKDVSEETDETIEVIASESQDPSTSGPSSLPEPLSSEVAHPEPESAHSGDDKTEQA
jgi:hypothetical protein